jgi:hypothetical protein
MKTRVLVAFAFLTLLFSCSTFAGDAEEFGSTEFTIGVSICDGETWMSNEANEKLCVRRSSENPNTFLITQDMGEYWTEKFGAFALLALSSYFYDPTGLLQEAYNHFVNDDPPAKWRKAADQYMRKHYGAKAQIVEFEQLETLGGYIFEVKPGDQIPPWEETEIPEYVLASQMPAEPWREPESRSGALLAQLARKNRPVLVARKNSPVLAPSSQSLTAMLDKAVQSSRQPGREDKYVRVEVLDPKAYQRYLAASGVEPTIPKSLTN